MAPSLSKYGVREILLRSSVNGLTHAQNLYNCLTRGEADYLSQYGNDPTLLRRAKAEVRNSKILYHVRALMLEDTQHYQFVEDVNSFYVRVEGCLHARFKKLDARGRSAKGKTKRDSLYRLQDGNCLPFALEVPKWVNLDVGYALDDMGSVALIFFSCCAPFSFGPYWTLPAKDLGVLESQPSLFVTPEQDILPVLQLDLKDYLKKTNDEQQANRAI